MGLLDFLVTSKTRRKLLRLLWGEGIEASVHQLAALAHTPYYPTYKELETMRKEGLVKAHRVGKAVLHRKNEQYPAGGLLYSLLGAKKSRRNEVSENDVKLNLERMGAPLGVAGESGLLLPYEETLALSLNLARKDPTIARVLPVAFARHKDELNFDRLAFLARKEHATSTLGFFLDLTSFLLADFKLKREAKKLFDHRRKKIEDFFVVKKVNAFEAKLAEMNTPKLALHWHFRMNMGLDSFESLFRKNETAGRTT